MADTNPSYAFVSVPKKSNNAGRPTEKKRYIVLIRLQDLKTFTKDAKNVRVTALALNGTAKPIGLYCTASTINGKDSVDGDDDARGFVHDLTFDHPGSNTEIQEFKEANVNEPLIALVGDCTEDDFTVFGTPEAPLSMTKADQEDSKDKKNNSFEFKNTYRTAPLGKMAQSLVPITDSDAVNTALGLTAAAAPAANASSNQTSTSGGKTSGDSDSGKI